MAARMPLIGFFIGLQTTLVSSAMSRVIMGRELPDLGSRLLPLVVVSCFGLDTALIVIEGGDSIIVRC